MCRAAAVAALFAAAASGSAWQSEPPSPSPEPARKIFVDAFQGKRGSSELRDRVVSRLRASRDVKVVDNAPGADFVVRGTGEIWLKGYVSVNPHPTASVHEPVYGGYLSLEVQRKSGEVLWSYLVTPGRLHWSATDQDMADRIVKLMLVALKHASGQAGQQAEASHGQVTLSGAGSTFAAPLYQSWIQSFEERHPEVRTTYQAAGSEAGIRMLEERKVDFAASDVPVSDEEMASMPVKFHQYATALGGVVPAYNLKLAGGDLRFTPEILAGIYLGKITKWNDPKLASVNRGAGLPDQPIIVLHRSEGSGTSFAWTEFLSRFSPEWKASVGSGMRVAWPIGVGVSGNDGVATGVAETPGSIGYVEMTYAIRHELSFGMVRNAAGRFVQANLDTLSAAAAAPSVTGDLRTSLIDASGKDAYPVTTFTWILLPTSQEKSQKSAALGSLLQWMLTSGQKECAGLGYVPLPRSLAERELAQARSAIPASAANPRSGGLEDSTAFPGKDARVPAN
jgi:phosphate transport system substrate-binding protein